MTLMHPELEAVRGRPYGIVYGYFFGACKRVYIGSTTALRARRYRHEHALERGTHKTPFFQHVYSKHGPAAMEFRILSISRCDYSTDDAPLRSKEAEIVRQYQNVGWEMLNTMQPTSVNRWTHSTAIRNRLRDFFTGRPVAPFTEEHRHNLSLASRGKKKPERQVERLRLLNVGRKHTLEVRQHQSEMRQGKPLPERELICSVCGDRYIGRSQKSYSKCPPCRILATTAKYKRYEAKKNGIKK